MKKILFLVIFLGFLASIDHTQIFALFNNTNAEVIATVNGDPIYFEEIETLYDIKYAQKTIQAPRVSELHREYATLLYTRIEQMLVAQELQHRGLEISDARIESFTKLVSQDHFDEEAHETKTFQELVEESGIQYDTWEKQIRIRLQIETLQQDITKNIVLEPNEITQYVHNHPELAHTSETYDIILLKSNKKDDLDILKKKENYDTDYIKEKKIQNLSGFFSVQNIPEYYQKPLENLTNENFSEIITVDNGFEMIYVVNHTKTQAPSTIELYALAEEALLAEKAEAAYDTWLIKALENADIRIEEKFLPAHLPKVQTPHETQSEQQQITRQNLEKNLTGTDTIEP